MNRREEIFAGFLQRRFFPRPFLPEEIAFEIEILKECEFEREYLRVNRAGASWPLNRKLRYEIWGLWENAANHADFEEWLEVA